MDKEHQPSPQLIKSLTQIGIDLSREKDPKRLLDMILEQAMTLTNADGGTLYTVTDDKKLKFEILINRSKKIHLGGTSKSQTQVSDLPLYNDQGHPNLSMLATSAVLKRRVIILKDAYKTRKFDLSGMKHFDENFGYHSKSFLVIPMTNHLNEVIGVMQLINAINPKNHHITSFSHLDRVIGESLASQAAIVITNRQLIKAQKDLFDALIQLIAKAIDEKSPYTANHCRRVPVIAHLIAEAASKTKVGPLSDFKLSPDEFYELEVAAWLHDCGKITTPEAVVDKATKLEGIHDGIELVDTRFEIVKRDAVIQYLKTKLQEIAGIKLHPDNDKELQATLKTLDSQRDFIHICNIGGETIAPQQVEKIKSIGRLTWKTASGESSPVLSEKEIENLSIARGTLSNQDRAIINNHVVVTLKMLEALPYPKNLKNVPLLAGSHHEKVDGTGYPRGLTRDQMPVQARIIAMADVFEALTSGERPYKKAMTLSKALTIMGKMKLEGHLDPDLFDVFIREKVYQKFAKDYLNPRYVDKVDLTQIPGYGQ